MDSFKMSEFEQLYGKFQWGFGSHEESVVAVLEQLFSLTNLFEGHYFQAELVEHPSGLIYAKGAQSLLYCLRNGLKYKSGKRS